MGSRQPALAVDPRAWVNRFFPADRHFSRKACIVLLTPWYLRLTTGSPTRSRRPRSGRSLSRRSVLPRLEGLEDRSLLSTFMVANLNDSGPHSLRAGIQSGDATIDFAPGLHGTITLKSGDLAITTSVTIDGPGANKVSVSGNDANQVFNISGSASVSIAGLTLTEGLANSGGAILLEGSSALNLSNCTLTGNDALGITRAAGNAAGGGFGGAIEDDSSGALNVTNSTFGANKAIGIGANDSNVGTYYILALGGAIDVNYEATGPATISNSTFTGNQALGGSPGASAGGGALSNSSNDGATMTVTGCTLSSNAAIGAAGGDGENNFGSGQGGALNNFANLIVHNSTLTNNLALGTPMAPGAVPSQTVSSGSATAGGGIFCIPGIFGVTSATATITDSTLVGNQAVGGAGAAGSASVAGSAGSIGEGGGISLIAVESALVDGCTLADNVALGGAGGSSGGAGGGLGAPGVSGGIDLAFGSPVTVSNTTLINNQAIGGAGAAGSNGGDGVGGGVNVGSGVIYGAPDNCSLTLTDSTIIGNLAQGGAGGAGNDGGDGTGGGVSVLAGSSASIDATWIVANAALGGSPGTGGASGQGSGGGLYIDTGALVTLTKSTKVILNFASTSADDIFGVYTIT